jgi:serine/threonine-protein kinase
VGLPHIPGYEFIEPLGEGGTGIVFRAVRLADDELVAVKILHPTLSDQRSWDRESRLMAAVKHPNLVTVHEAGDVDGRPFLVMEYVPGPSLRKFLTPGFPWSPQAAWLLIDAVAGALTALHFRGILHLDLKPENILLRGGSAHGEAVKLTDFGLARGQHEVQSLAALDAVQSSMCYSSPEQRHGLPLDVRSDLFSLAVLTYELLTGQLPGRVYVPVRKRQPELGPLVDPLLQAGLARDPAERPPSVETFRRDLAAALAGGEA